MDYANDTEKTLKNNKNDVFYQGKSLAYYEMLGVLKLELEVTGEDLRDYGLSYDIE